MIPAPSGTVCARCKRPTSPSRVHRCYEDRAKAKRAQMERVPPVPIQFHKGISCDEASAGKACAHCGKPMRLGGHLAASGWRHYACEPPKR